MPILSLSFLLIRSKYMKKNFILIALLLLPSLCWAKTGFYSGSFDPPTLTDIEIIKDSLQTFELDQLIIMVDRVQAKSNGYNASALERLDMLKTALSDCNDRIHTVIEPWSGKELYLDSLRKQNDVQIIVNKSKQVQRISSLVEKVIKNRGLYTGISEAMTPLKQSLHQEAFQAFLRETSLHFPEDNLQNISSAPFLPLMSDLARVDQYIYFVIREKHFQNEKAEAFGKTAEKLLLSSIRSESYAKLHGLQEVFYKPLPRPDVTVHSLAMPILPKDQKHTLNVEIYCSDRFPKALFNSHLFSENDTYFHMGSTEEAIAYHQAEGFNEIYEVKSQAVRKLRNYHLVKNPSSSKIRFLVSNLSGEDNLQHVANQCNAIAEFNKVHLVRHANPLPLFEVEPRYKDLTFQSTDTMIIGFKNAITRLVKGNADWNITSFSISGLPIDLYENRRTKERIVASKCVYGDQLVELLHTFHKKGIRQLLYLGTAGSLSPQIHTGDVIIPLAFSTPQNTRLPFHNRAAKLLQKVNDAKIKLVQLHGWTYSPVIETEDFLKKLQKSGNQSIDVEARYLGEFCHTHPDTSASMVLFISDEPFGEIKLEHFNTVDYYVDEAFNTVINSLLPGNLSREDVEKPMNRSV